jgi:hypothetical protein
LLYRSPRLKVGCDGGRRALASGAANSHSIGHQAHVDTRRIAGSIRRLIAGF